MNDLSSVLVIGGGASGLVSSLLLSRAGVEVTLLERDERVAPLLRNFNYQGFEVSNGFHYLGGYYPGSALHRSFEQLGLNDKLKPLEVNQDCFDCFSGITDEDISVPVGRDPVRSVLEESFPGSRQALAEYFELMDRVFREFSFFDITDYSLKVAQPLAKISLFDFLAERKAEESLISFLGAYSEALLGLTAREVSLLIHLLGVGAYFYSVHTFEGGGGALARALEERVREAGVRVLTAMEVTGVECESRRRFGGLRVRSVHDGRESTLEADACLSTIHPKRFLQLLPREAAYQLFASRVSRYEDTKAVYVFHLAMKGEAARRFRGNYHRAIRDENGRLKHHFSLLPDFTSGQESPESEKRVSVILTAWENGAKTGCPERKGNHCYERQGLPAYTSDLSDLEHFQKYRPEMESRLEGVFPELKGKYRVVSALSPCHLDRLNATWQGSIYGVKCSFNRVGLVPAGPMRGLHFAGQSITAPGIFGALASAYLACGHIMKRDFI